MLFTIETVKSQIYNAFLCVPGFDLPIVSVLTRQ